MRISVIGCGRLGAVHAVCMANLGHDVVGVDVSETVVTMLNSGTAPFHEPGLAEALRIALATGRLRFETDFSSTSKATVHFLAVGTPQQKSSGDADLSYLDSAVSSLIPHLSTGDLLVGKSTVPVGTAAALNARLQIDAPGVSLVWNPEFLREGHAIRDTIHPSRMVFGFDNDADAAVETATLHQVYGSVITRDVPVVTTDFATAELTKVVANVFLATKISFINAVSEVATAAGADVSQLADAIGLDDRIGRQFLNAGLGFGGGCLPKDLRAFIAKAEDLGTPQSVQLLHEVERINLRQRDRVVNLALDQLDDPRSEGCVAVLGLAFKPHSDDLRDSPALEVALRLAAEGVRVQATDPAASELAASLFPSLVCTPSIGDTLRGANAVILTTDWPEYRDLEPDTIVGLPTNPVIIDARNCLNPEPWRTAGWTYIGVGR